MKEGGKNMISIIIPIHNAEKTIEKCLDSILSQNYINYEVLCIDDESTDETEKICKRYVRMDDRIGYFRKKNGGPASARNYGLKLCQGDYVLFVDSDDSLVDGMLQIMREKFQEDEIDLVICGFYLNKLDKQLVEIKGHEFVGSKELFIKNEFEKSYFDFMINAPWNKMIRYSVIKECNISFREEFWFLEDLIFSLDLICQTRNIAVVGECLYYYNYYTPGALTTRYNHNTADAILEVGSKLDLCLKPYGIDMGEFYSDIIHKMWVHFNVLHAQMHIEKSKKQLREYEIISSDQFKYYLKNAKSRKNKNRLKVAYLIIKGKSLGCIKYISRLS